MRDISPVIVAARSNQEHVGALTLNGKPMPFLHLNARSRYIQPEEIHEVYVEDIWAPVTTAVEGPRW